MNYSNASQSHRAGDEWINDAIDTPDELIYLDG